MLESLVIISALIWLPIFVHQLTHRGLLVLMIWIFVGPIASNLVDNPGRNPVFPPSTFAEDEEEQPNQKRDRLGGYFSETETIRVKELLEPTRLLFGLFFVTFLGQSMIRERRLLSLDRTEKWMLVFSLLILVNVTLFSRRFAFSARIAIDAFIVPFLAYLTARRLVPDEDRFNQFIRAMAYFGCFLIVICLIERILHPSLVHRVQGPFPRRDYLYVVMMVIFFLVVAQAVHYWLKRDSSVLPRWVYMFIGLGSPVIILFTLTRGNWVGFLAGCWTFAFLGRTLLTRRQRLASVGLGVGLVPIILLGILELSQTEFLSTRLSNLSTIEARLRTYALVIEAGGQNPIFGIGLNNLRDYLRQQSSAVQGRTLGTAHSSYLGIFAELGIFALVAYLGIMWSVCRTGLRIFHTEKGLKERWYGAAVVAMMTGYLVPALFSHMAYSPLFIHVYLFACVGAIAGRYGFPRLRLVTISAPVKAKDSPLPQVASSR